LVSAGLSCLGCVRRAEQAQLLAEKYAKCLAGAREVARPVDSPIREFDWTTEMDPLGTVTMLPAASHRFKEVDRLLCAHSMNKIEA
jgi:hypothetical protein